MNWKGRQMFGGKPNGIVQMMGGGMTPYPSHTMPDGTVMRGAVHGQGYEAGGLSKSIVGSLIEEAGGLSKSIVGSLIEENQFVDPSPSPNDQKLLTEETKELKDLYNNIITAMQSTDMDFNTIIDSRVTQGSITKKAADDLKKVYAIQKMREMQNPPPMPKADNNFRDKSYARPMPVAPTDMNKMQVGGMVGAELFEEGDNDVNNALNMMASVSNPEVPEMPANNGMELASEKMVGEEMTMDQGSGYQEDVMQLKELFKNEIRSYVAQSGTTDLDKYLKQIGVAYRNKLGELKDRYGIEEYSPSEDLITEDFLAELSGKPPMIGMQGAGTVFSDEEKIAQQKILTELGINIPLERWLNTPEKEREDFIRAFTILRSTSAVNPTASRDLTRADLDTGAYDSLSAERRANAERLGQATKDSYRSTQKSLLHSDSADKAKEFAEASALDAFLKDQIANEKGILGYLSQVNASTTGATSRQNLPADVISDMYGVNDFKSKDRAQLSKIWEKMIDPTSRSNVTFGTTIEENFENFVMNNLAIPPILEKDYGGSKFISNQVETDFIDWFKQYVNEYDEDVKQNPDKEMEFTRNEHIKNLQNEWRNAPDR